MKRLLLVVVLALGGWWLLRSPHGGPLAPQAPRPADGVLVSEEPVYGGLDFRKTWMPLGAFQEMAQGTVDVTARVLARQDYPRTGDGEVLPTDLVLGWGPMSDNRVIDHVTIRLADRGLTVIPDASAGISAKVARASTMVVAPYSDFHEHAVALDALRVGDVIHLYGWDMKIKRPDGSTWTGGNGQEEIGDRAFIVKGLMLQVGDRKVFGNWEAYSALSHPSSL